MKVGDYVRTPQGIIAKIVNIQEDTEQYFLNGNAVSLESKNYITDKNITIGENFKHNPRIIDLIEVGDYVNGKRVEWIGYDLYRENEDKTLTGIGEKRILFNEFTKDSVREKGIKSIVTKEQFKSMEYKVKE